MTTSSHTELDQLISRKNGSVDPSKFPDEIFDLYSIPAFDTGKPEIVKGSEIGSTKQIVQSGDVLLSKIVPHIRRTWIVGADAGRRMIASGEWIVFRNGKADAAYLRQVLISNDFHAKFMQTVSGVGGSLLRAKPTLVAKISIYLPKIEEQKRIAAILDQADALRTTQRETLTQLDSLAQATFVEMFGDPVSNPMRWPKVAFEEACSTKLGKMLDAKKQSGEFSKKYLRNANVQWFRFDLRDVFEMDFHEKDKQTFNLKPGDLLICEGGEPGRAAIWNGEIEDCYFQKALHRGRINPKIAIAEYVVWLLWFLAKRGGLADHITAATISHLTGEKLKAMQIPLPPLALQEKFSAKMRLLEQQKSLQQQKIAELNTLFTSLQHRAFRGEL